LFRNYPDVVLVLHHDTVVLLLEPLDGILLAHSVMNTQRALGDLLLGDSATGSSDLDVEVHTVDTSAGVVFDTQIDVLLETESETALLTEVSFLQLVLLDLQTLLENLLGLLASDGNVASDLIVTTDTEASDGVARLRKDGLLISELLEHLSGTGESVTRLADADVQNKLLDAGLTHRVVLLGLLVSGLDL